MAENTLQSRLDTLLARTTEKRREAEGLQRELSECVKELKECAAEYHASDPMNDYERRNIVGVGECIEEYLKKTKVTAQDISSPDRREKEKQAVEAHRYFDRLEQKFHRAKEDDNAERLFHVSNEIMRCRNATLPEDCANVDPHYERIHVGCELTEQKALKNRWKDLSKLAQSATENRRCSKRARN
eukprot:gb/GECG01012866.1/.p1 GENE.gb/GECG01012866.1/~~gb/GECG01012866.1/.p1  ORF type:complete len:186 (+),score=24.14 gb/GECG01012866.1/:1-558(+)